MIKNMLYPPLFKIILKHRLKKNDLKIIKIENNKILKDNKMKKNTNNLIRECRGIFIV